MLRANWTINNFKSLHNSPLILYTLPKFETREERCKKQGIRQQSSTTYILLFQYPNQTKKFGNSFLAAQNMRHIELYSNEFSHITHYITFNTAD